MEPEDDYRDSPAAWDGWAMECGRLALGWLYCVGAGLLGVACAIDAPCVWFGWVPLFAPPAALFGNAWDVALYSTGLVCSVLHLVFAGQIWAEGRRRYATRQDAEVAEREGELPL